MLHARSTAAIVATIASIAVAVPVAAASAAGTTRPAASSCTTTSSALAAPASTPSVADPALPAAASHTALSASSLATVLRTDSTARLDACGRVVYVDEPAPAGPLALETPTRTTTLTTTAAAVDVFALSSRPGSHRTIYLDFTGYTLHSTAWNGELGLGADYALPAYDTDGHPGSFSADELSAIREVWQRVSEDYAPFDVNVTTRDPGAEALARTDDADDVYGARAVITSSTKAAAACGCGGIAFLSSIGWTGAEHDYFQPALVMTANLRNGWAKAVAEAASHEVGHTFGLTHDGVVGGDAYYAGASAWAPIMGVGYYRPLTQWSKGEYAAANNPQDDVAVIAQHAPLVADDHGGSAATATQLAPGVATAGLIGSSQDEDWFAFTSLGGAVTVAVTPAAVGADLDVRLQIIDADGTAVATVAPVVPDPMGQAETTTGLDAVYRADALPAGSYRARVTGAGQGAVKVDGWSAYGSLGRYTITVTGSAPAPLAVTTAAMAEGITGQPYAARLTASGALGVTRWTVPAGSLPRGLRLDASTGAVTGRPGVAAAVSLRVSVADAGGRSVTRAVRLVVRAPVRVATSALGAARHGATYRTRLTAVGGTGRAYWRVWSGAVPHGVTLTSGGLLRGRPLRAGIYRFTVLVMDSASGVVHPGHWASRSYRLVVR